MDKGSLVDFGRAVAEAMDGDHMAPRGLMWVNNSDTQTWKLWVIPPAGLSDRREFYRRTAVIMSRIRDKFPNNDISDIEYISESHPAIMGLSRMFRLEGLTNVSLTGNSFNGVYIPDGILMRMML